MKVVDFVSDLVEKLVKKELYLDSEVKMYNEKDGLNYQCGTVSHVLKSVNVHVEPIDDIPGKYCLLDNRTKRPISPYLFEFSHKRNLTFEI